MARPTCWGAVVVAVLLTGVACGKAEVPTPPAARTPAEDAALEALSGAYDVRGVTAQAMSGRQRPIAGSLRLRVTGERYEVEFELQTIAPDFDEPVPVEVRGTGRGLVVGNVFAGTTEEWMALPPSGDLDEVRLHDVELPAQAGRKLASTSRASFDERGVFQIVMQNYPGPDDRYEPSLTVLEGRREEAEAELAPPR